MTSAGNRHLNSDRSLKSIPFKLILQETYEMNFLYFVFKSSVFRCFIFFQVFGYVIVCICALIECAFVSAKFVDFRFRITCSTVGILIEFFIVVGIIHKYSELVFDQEIVHSYCYSNGLHNSFRLCFGQPQFCFEKVNRSIFSSF